MSGDPALEVEDRIGAARIAVAHDYSIDPGRLPQSSGQTDAAPRRVRHAGIHTPVERAGVDRKSVVESPQATADGPDGDLAATGVDRPPGRHRALAGKRDRDEPLVILVAADLQNPRHRHGSARPREPFGFLGHRGLLVARAVLEVPAVIRPERHAADPIAPHRCERDVAGEIAHARRHRLAGIRNRHATILRLRRARNTVRREKRRDAWCLAAELVSRRTAGGAGGRGGATDAAGPAGCGGAAGAMDAVARTRGLAWG